MIVNKHESLRRWAEKFLAYDSKATDSNMYFENVEITPGLRTLVPRFGEYVNRADVLGNKYKSYTFLFTGCEMLGVGTSPDNTENMDVFDRFTSWIESENKTFENFSPSDDNVTYYYDEEIYNDDGELIASPSGVFPFLGENTIEYQLFPLQNMANIATITEDGTAKYMLAVRIDYIEEDKED